jgi:transposase
MGSLEVVKTVRVPVHYALTKRKLSIVDKLTARLSYCTWLFSKLIEERNLNVEGYGEFARRDIATITKLTKLSSAYVQQCRDQALWTWRSYQALHKEWEHRLMYARRGWRERLLKREPQKPFHKGLSKKVPVRLDSRTGVLETSKRIKLCPYVLRLSTLRKKTCITIPLNPAEYHLNLLERGRVVDFQLVKRNDRYYAHVCIKYEIQNIPVNAVRGIDLGVCRAIATVLLKPDQPLRRGDLSILKDLEKKHRLDMLNRRVAGLQRAEKWAPLKRLRHKGRNISEQYDRLDAIRIAELAKHEYSMVAIGYPKHIKYESFCGNGERKLRRILQQRFPYGRRIRYIIEECAERGVRAELIPETWTSKRCHRCGSLETRRIGQSLFWCHHCGLQYNADWNSAMNIGSVFFAKRLSRLGAVDSPEAGEDLASEASEPGSRHPFMGGEQVTSITGYPFRTEKRKGGLPDST